MSALRSPSHLGTLQAMTTGDDVEHVGLKEAAAILGVHPNTVRNRITSGKLPAIKAMTPTGEAYIIARKDLHPLHPPTKGVGSGIAPYNNLVPPIDGENDVFVGVPSTLPVSLTRALQQVVAPLIEENTRLQGVARQQAEELGQTREQRDQARREVAELKRQLSTAAASSPPLPDRPAPASRARPRSLLGQFAARVAARLG